MLLALRFRHCVVGAFFCVCVGLGFSGGVCIDDLGGGWHDAGEGGMARC
jgi:hypothetical protein